jgi:hypothetical protein
MKEEDLKHPAIELALLVKDATAALRTQRPARVPQEFHLSYILDHGIALNVWLPPRVDTAAMMAVIGSILREDRFVGVLRHSVCERRESPLLLLTQNPLLDSEVLAVQGFEGLYSGGCQIEGSVKQGFAHSPDEYQSLWWSTLEDWEGEFLIQLDVQWYAAVMQRVERLLGFPPRKDAIPQDWQRPMLFPGAN